MCGAVVHAGDCHACWKSERGGERARAEDGLVLF